MRRQRAGFTLIEFLAALGLLSIAMVAVSALFTTQNRLYLQQDVRAAMEENLRMGMNMVTDALRDAKYGVPAANLGSWVTWVPQFTSNPAVTHTAGAPDGVSVASASAQPVATLTAHEDAGATRLYLSSTDQVNAGSKRLLLIGDSEPALITAVDSTTITIDTDPTVSGNQGLARAYPLGTPIYRVDVITFTIATDAAGVSQLLRDENHGAGPQAAVEGISGLSITTVTAGKQYQVALTARSAKPDPSTGRYLQGSLQSNVTLAN